MARVPMLVAFAVRRAANATTAAGKAMWDGKGLILVGGAAVAAWAFRADLRRLAHRLAHRLFSDGGFSGRLDWGLRVKGRREDNRGARRQLGQAHRLYSQNHGGAGTR